MAACKAGFLRILLVACVHRTRAPVVCEYQVSDIIQFDLDEAVVVNDRAMTMASLNVGFSQSGISSMDMASPLCISGNCPVILKGDQLDKLLPDLQAGSTFQDVYCFFGPELPCSSVPTTIRSDELMCGTPTLPSESTIVPFGVLVLGPKGTEPGTLYLPSGLEVNFFDSAMPPTLLRLDPQASDIVDVPDSFTVYGYNLGPGRTGVPQPLQCKWGDEQAQTGTYTESLQLRGDAESSIECPPPLGTYSQGQYARLRVGMAGPLSMLEGVFSPLPSADPTSDEVGPQGGADLASAL